MRINRTPVYNGERRPNGHIGAAFGIATFLPEGVSGRLVMIWVGIFYLAVLAILLDAMYRAPELDWHD
jgi:type IV secretory pathway VirB3-like protein